MAKIIVIDDDPLVRSVLKGFLQMGNHQVIEVENGRQTRGA